MLVANLMLSAAFLATAQKTPESMLGAALHQEEVQGDLQGAIAAYQKVLAAPGVSRKTAAAALVRMGQCYEELGDGESRKVYERVVREFADQKEAVMIARTRLGGHQKPESRVSTRQIWTGAQVAYYAANSPDGRLLSFVDQMTGNLAVHDLGTGADRPLTGKSGWSESDEFAEYSTFSPDGKRVAYAWSSKGRYELRVAAVEPGGPHARIL